MIPGWLVSGLCVAAGVILIKEVYHLPWWLIYGVVAVAFIGILMLPARQVPK